MQQKNKKVSVIACLLYSGLLVHGAEIRARLTEGIWVVLLPNSNHCKHNALVSMLSDNIESAVLQGEWDVRQHRSCRTFSGAFRVQRAWCTKDFVLWGMLESGALNLQMQDGQMLMCSE